MHGIFCSCGNCGTFETGSEPAGHLYTLDDIKKLCLQEEVENANA